MKISIDVLQKYLLERYGGWANEQGLFLKLVEEIGEVAEVIKMANVRSFLTDLDTDISLLTKITSTSTASPSI